MYGRARILGRSQIHDVVSDGLMLYTICDHFYDFRNFDHPNLVKLLGICLKQPIKIVTEYMKHGEISFEITLKLI